MNADTKTALENMLAVRSESFRQKEAVLFSTQQLAKELSLSRSVVSHYLNELHNEGVLIKIATRPVMFLHKKTLEAAYGVALRECAFLSLEELDRTLAELTDENSSFHRMIGCRGSLQTLITQCTSALLYPPYGLPIIFYGAAGTGKGELVQALFEYGLSHQRFFASARLEHLYLEKGEQDVSRWRRCWDWLRSGEGMLCIHHAQHLCLPFREQLQTYLQEYQQGRKRVFIVLCMEEDPGTLFSAELLKQFPLLIAVPSLEERGADEKEALLVHYLREEQKRVHKQIWITASAFRCLCQHVYAQNQEELQKVVTLTCVKAMDVQSDRLAIALCHLPRELSAERMASPEEDPFSGEMLQIEHVRLLRGEERLVKLFENILGKMDTLLHKGDPFAFVSNSYQQIKEVSEVMMLRRSYSDEQVKALEEQLRWIFAKIERRFSITVPACCTFVLSRGMWLLTQDSSALRSWEKRSAAQLEQGVTRLKEVYPNDSFICGKIRHMVDLQIGLKLHLSDQLLLMICLAYYDGKRSRRSYCGMIISHGYATASSICDAVNTLLGEYVFDAIDMPLDTDTEEIVHTIEQYLRRYDPCQGILILVDMGSLEQLGTHFAKTSKCAIGIINNVSTRMALSIGNDILQGKRMDEILSRSTQAATPSYTYLPARQQRRAIVFTSESGEETARKIEQLFESSLPAGCSVVLETADFSELQRYGESVVLFQRYAVACIVGTMDPQIRKVPFIAIEDIITGSSAAVEQILAEELSKEELEELKEQLIINFSLQNVMEHLTILNPNCLMRQVVEAIGQLEYRLQLPLEGKRKIALYLHISCMIERLVTKNNEAEKEDLHLFQQEQAAFIEAVENSFATLLTHYHVTLPMEEIFYLYEYTVGNEQEARRYREE